MNHHPTRAARAGTPVAHKVHPFFPRLSYTNKAVAVALANPRENSTLTQHL
jgi:hypothetical protein